MSEWISIKDRLPDAGVDVLVFDGSVSIGRVPAVDSYLANHEPHKTSVFACYGYDYDGDLGWAPEASHWMPLPKAPLSA